MQHHCPGGAQSTDTRGTWFLLNNLMTVDFLLGCYMCMSVSCRGQHVLSDVWGHVWCHSFMCSFVVDLSSQSSPFSRFQSGPTRGVWAAVLSLWWLVQVLFGDYFSVSLCAKLQWLYSWMQNTHTHPAFVNLRLPTSSTMVYCQWKEKDKTKQGQVY